MKKKINLVKLSENQQNGVKGGVITRPCLYFGPPDPPPGLDCTCYIGMGRCAWQIWFSKNPCLEP
jgi:hypothetical protein